MAISDITDFMIEEFNTVVRSTLAGDQLTKGVTTCTAPITFNPIDSSVTTNASRKGKTASFDDLDTLGELTKYKESASKLWDAAISSLSANITASITAANLEAQINPTENWIVQDATSPHVIAETPAALEVVASAPVFQDAEYNPGVDYPNTVTTALPNGDWFKINMIENYAEFVHSASGSSLKVDKEGNVGLHIAKSLKVTITEDAVINITGNLDNIVLGDRATHTYGDSEDMTIGERETNTIANHTEDVVGIHQSSGATVYVEEYPEIFIN
jgi:hypothetical protein